MSQTFVGGAILPVLNEPLWIANRVGFFARLIVDADEVRVEPVRQRLFRRRSVLRDEVSTVLPRTWFGWFGLVEVRYGPYGARFLFSAWPFASRDVVLGAFRETGYEVSD